jgi:hypothetical protein
MLARVMVRSLPIATLVTISLTGTPAYAADPVLVAPAAGAAIQGAYVSDTAVIAADVTFTATVDPERAGAPQLRVASRYADGLLTEGLIAQADMTVNATGTSASVTVNVRGVTGPYYWQVVHGFDASEIRELTLAEPPPTAPPNIKGKRSQLTPAGYRGMRVGMTLRKAARTGRVRFSKVQRMPGSDCGYASIRGRKLSVMLDGKRIVRFETTTQRPGAKPSPVNGLGAIKVGDAALEIETVFGRSAAHLRHEYVDGGWYYDIDYTSGAFRGRSIRFETDASGLVTKVIVGRTAETKYVEGCA